MNPKYIQCVMLLLLSLAVTTVNAQRAFDQKKRPDLPANTSSLNARKIQAPRKTDVSRSSGANMFSKDRNFAVQPKGHRVLNTTRDGHPTFIESRKNTGLSVSTRKDFQTGSYDYLKELEPLLGITETGQNFVIGRVQHENGVPSHIRMQQHYHGVPIHGAEVIVHLNSLGEGESFNGKYVLIKNEINITPSIQITTAIEHVRTDIKKGSPSRPLTFLERRYVQHADPVSTLCLYEDVSLVTTYRLAYHVLYSPSIHRRWEYFIDAHTGEVISRINTICSVDGPKTATANDLNGVSRSINTFQKGANVFMLDASRSMFNATNSVLPDEPVGGILTIDMSNTFGDNAAFSHVSTTTNVWNTANHAKAVSAHFNAGKAFEYYLTNHARTSINGEGGSIISIINVSDPDNGTAMDNAFWNGKAMFYGNGNTDFKPLAGSMDVAGHELTHGVVENTANLEYQGESGAINESMADIFGSMMDVDDWLIGEDVVKAAAYPSGALRSMSDPHNGGTSLANPGFQPKHMNEKFTGPQDNGGVHINSGIINHAFFKYAESITRDKAAKVFYRALNNYLTKSSQFVDLRLAVVKAAGDLFGTSSNEVTKAGEAFTAVGIATGQGGDFEEELPQNPGAEFLLVYNTDSGVSGTLHRAPVTALNTAVELSSTAAVSKPSITDDGSIAVFVGADKKIHALVIQPGEDPDEFIIQDEAIWSNVAISKGGLRMAAVTQQWDNTIYVYDFESEEWGEFELYNPTYSDGVNSGGTVYADALEWDYTGEFIVYDAWNRYVNTAGEDITYWDVNFIKAWDLTTGDFGDGSISKLFASLPEGVSIGNPTFAKLSPQVLAFDMVNEFDETMAILGSNIETGETDIIFENNTLGFPSFNKNDSRIAFTLDDGASNFYTGFVKLNANKISSPDASETGIFTETMWPVYFATGIRDIGNEVTSIFPEREKTKISCFPNPFVGDLSMDMKNEFVGAIQVNVTNLLGQQLVRYDLRTDGNLVELSTANLPSGHYILHIRQGTKSGACRVLKSN